MDKASVEKEAKRHGSPGFPLAVYDNYVRFPEYSKEEMYLRWYRLVQAEQLLKETDLKVIDVALEVGFQDINHFIHLFHEHTGATPSQFRSRYRSAM